MTGWRLLAVTLALLGLALASEQAVEIRSSHHFISSAATVRWPIRIAKHPDNRTLVFTATDRDDGSEVRRTEEQLDGEHAALVRWIAWRLSAGNLVLTAQVLGVNGRHAKDGHVVCVYDLLRPCGEDRGAVGTTRRDHAPVPLPAKSGRFAPLAARNPDAWFLAKVAYFLAIFGAKGWGG